MTGTVRGVVLSVHAFGATVRLDDGRLAGAPRADVDAHRNAYERAAAARKPLEFLLREQRGRLVTLLAPQMQDPHLEEQIAQYLKMTAEWERPDSPPAHERHFLRKKRRAALFESRHSADR